MSPWHAAVRAAVGSEVAVTAKLNMEDGVPRGLQPDGSLQVAALLEADGHLNALQLTAGSSLLNGMYFFRGEVPMAEFIATQPPLVRLGLRVLGRRISRPTRSRRPSSCHSRGASAPGCRCR